MNLRSSSASVCLLVLVLGCAPGAPKSPMVPRSPEVGPMAPPQAPMTRGGGQTSKAFDETVVQGREFLLETGIQGPPIQDVVVGPVYRGSEAQAVVRFLESAALGRVDTADLDPDWADYLGAWARKAQDEGLGGQVRVGAPLTGRETSVPVRVWGPDREWVGWVVLVRSEQRWLVTDAQLSPRPRDPSPFDPEEAQPISRPNLR